MNLKRSYHLDNSRNRKCLPIWSTCCLNESEITLSFLQRRGGRYFIDIIYYKPENYLWLHYKTLYWLHQDICWISVMLTILVEHRIKSFSTQFGTVVVLSEPTLDLVVLLINGCLYLPFYFHRNPCWILFLKSLRLCSQLLSNTWNR